MEGSKTKEQQGVLLFEEDDAEATSSDPQLEQKISKYLQERALKSPSSKGPIVTGEVKSEGADEEHTGITDDEGDVEGEPDYDVASRMTMKASSEAFLEVMQEARREFEKEKEAARQKKAAAKGTTKELPTKS